MSATETTTDLREPPRVSGDDGGTGHLEELRRDPIGLMERVRAECGDVGAFRLADRDVRSEEHTSELQSLMRISYAVFCLQKKNTNNTIRILITLTSTLFYSYL